MATSTKSPAFPKAIPSILFAAGALNKGAFVAVEVMQAIKNYQNGNVVAILDTLSILTNGKFEPQRNKAGTINMVAQVQDIAKASKTAFRKLGFALALLDIVGEDATEETGASYVELAKVYSDELKSAYEATKPAKQAKSVLTPATVSTDQPAENAVQADMVEIVTEDVTIDTLVAAMLDAIKAGALSDDQVADIRLALFTTGVTEVTEQTATTH